MNIHDLNISEFGNVPVDLNVIKSTYPALSRVDCKAVSLNRRRVLLRLKKGLYVVSPHITKKPLVEQLIANHLYGPSYVSMESALRYYGLIPEGVYMTMSMTTKLSKRFENEVGSFKYIHCEREYYHIGVVQQQESEVTFLVASPEKALCDTILYSTRVNLRYKKDVAKYLEEDLRIDVDALRGFDVNILKECLASGRKKSSIQQLINFIENEWRV